MSVNSELLCSFELLKPLDSNALKSHIKKQKHNRKHILNSPVRLHPLIPCKTGAESDISKQPAAFNPQSV